MKVLVTGVSGFIGSNLSRILIENNIDVIGIDNLSYGVKNQIPSGVKFFQEDIRDKQISGLFNKVDFVFHLAAKNSLIDCENNPIETHDINVNGTKNIFNISINKGIKKVIYAESSAVYEGVEVLPSVETITYPKSVYAKSKMETNAIAQQLFISKGLFATGLRYFNVTLHQDYRRTIPPVFSAFIIKMLQGERPLFMEMVQKRDFVYVDDVSDFHLMCMKNKLTDNNIYNINFGKNYSINLFMNELNQYLIDINQFIENFVLKLRILTI